MDAQRFVTSFSAGFCSSSCFFMSPHRLATAAGIEDISLYHIYAIARIPRVRLVPRSFSITEDGAACQYRIGHEFNAETRTLLFPPIYEVTSFESPDGAGQNFLMKFNNGELQGDFPLFLMKIGAYKELSAHEIIYIGQAYGKDGSRNIVDRLTKHETLQKIIAENNISAPATDVVVYGFQYTGNDQIFMLFDGTNKNLIGDERDDDRRNAALDNPIDDKKMTQIVEAALIRYFQPIYNEKFRKLFPADHHKFLDDIKNIDYDGFVVEIDTEDLGSYLYSPSQPKGMHHIVKFKITTRNTDPIFSFFRLMKETGLDPTSGPVF